jgi:alpha-1,2-glucosyltransferase
MAASVNLFTSVQYISLKVYFIIHLFHITSIHHPFLLSDNRHYTFYVWRRIFLSHPFVPYVFIPGYIACAWAWFLRVGEDSA